MNSVNIGGILSDDCEVRQMGNSKFTSIQFRIGYTTGYGENKEWSNITCKKIVESQKQIEFFRSKLAKGNIVYVSGYMKQEKWEKEGRKMYKDVVMANDINVHQKDNAGSDGPY